MKILQSSLKIQTPGNYRLHRTTSCNFHHSWLMRFLQKREKSAKPCPPQTHGFQITRGCTGQCQIKLHSCAAFPSHSKFGVWSTFVQQLNRLLLYICKATFPLCTVAQSSGWVIKHFKSIVRFKVYCSTTNCPACRSIRWNRVISGHNF